MKKQQRPAIDWYIYAYTITKQRNKLRDYIIIHTLYSKQGSSVARWQSLYKGFGKAKSFFVVKCNLFPPNVVTIPPKSWHETNKNWILKRKFVSGNFFSNRNNRNYSCYLIRNYNYPYILYLFIYKKNAEKCPNVGFVMKMDFIPAVQPIGNSEGLN